jgi:hypothetical protein
MLATIKKSPNPWKHICTVNNLMSKTGTICEKCGGYIQVAYYRGDEPKMCGCNTFPLPTDFGQKIIKITPDTFRNMDYQIKLNISDMRFPEQCTCWLCRP